MKRIIVAFLLILNIGIAYGASDKTITSKTYVDNQLATKQDKIRAIDDKTVITHTGSAGEIGEKGIYDSNESYADQQTSLVTAGDANTGINNALENEFVCVDEDTDGTCLLWKIKNTVNQSKNLFNIGNVPDTYNGTRLINNGDGTLTITATATNSAVTTGRKLSQLAPGLEVGKTYTFSFNTTSSLKYIALVISRGNSILWSDKAALTVTQQMLDTVLYFEAPITGEVVTISNIQIEEGSVATPYQPYGENTYIPSGN